jgi:hypothetical protein
MIQKLITGETIFGTCEWRRHGGTIILAAKQKQIKFSGSKIYFH